MANCEMSFRCSSVRSSDQCILFRANLDAFDVAPPDPPAQDNPRFDCGTEAIGPHHGILDTPTAAALLKSGGKSTRETCERSPSIASAMLES
jgi:hypothetical protein